MNDRMSNGMSIAPISVDTINSRINTFQIFCLLLYRTNKMAPLPGIGFVMRCDGFVVYEFVSIVYLYMFLFINTF